MKENKNDILEPEVTEITPEMIKAGEEVVSSYGEVVSSYLLVQWIYTAMYEAGIEGSLDDGKCRQES